MPVRMKDIARDLGVSVVTVSKVLRNHSDISAETRERVLQRMKELDYRPNLAARALVTGRSYMLGLIVPDLVHPFFGQVAKGLSQSLRKKGYSLVISSSDEDPELERQEIEQLLAHRVDALIIASIQCLGDGFRRIEEQKVPYVLVDRKFTGLNANFVGVDDELVGFIATEHLISQGCKRIAHLRGPDVSTAFGRLAGYQRALAEHNLTAPPEYVAELPSGGDYLGDVGGYTAATGLLKLSPRPDGLFCYNDPAAAGAIKAVLEAGLRVPKDIAIVGCGNTRYSEMLRIPLTSVDQDSTAIGERAAKLALSLIEAKSPARPRSILLEPKVLPRASSLRK